MTGVLYMKKHYCLGAILFGLTLILSGCSGIGDKSLSMSALYLVTAIAAGLILMGYLILCKQKNRWLLVLLGAVTVTNSGYWILSVADTLDAALMANRLSYLGSVFLPMSMLMITLGAARIRYKKWLPAALAGVSFLVFLVAASPGYLPIYYADVAIAKVGGVTVLEKVYGPWHRLYLFYLLGYFAVTVGVVASVIRRKKLHNTIHTLILTVALFLNISVWLLEQLVKVDFELLAVSYILSALFLIALDLLIWEQRRHLQALQIAAPAVQAAPASPAPCDDHVHFLTQLPTLTPTERHVYELYLEGKSSKDIMETLAIKENTLKYHNRNIYSKLGVSSRKQMLELAARAQSANN